MKKEENWIEAMKEKGHSPKLHDDGSLDFFAYEEPGYHNGPRCVVCGWGCCWHCDDTDVIPPCEALEGTANKGLLLKR